MSRHIQLTESDILQIVTDIKGKLEKTKNKLGEFVYSFTTQNTKEQEPVKIVFTPYAYYKMLTYVLSLDSEIAWQGLAHKVRSKEYKVTDVFVYPQRVTAAAVYTDDDKMAAWENDLDTDTYNGRRFHGHSHVNMGVTPSTVDMDMRKDTLTRLGEEGFYIFMIMNKKNEMSFEIYDYDDNIIYDTEDCKVYVEGFDKAPAEICSEAMSMIYKAQPGTYAAALKYPTGYQGNWQAASQTPAKKSKAKSTKSAKAKELYDKYYAGYVPKWYESEWYKDQYDMDDDRYY